MEALVNLDSSFKDNMSLQNHFIGSLSSKKTKKMQEKRELC